MLSEQKVARFLLLPELKLTAWKKDRIAASVVQAKKVSDFEVCPKCATVSKVVYDRRIVSVKDAPVRGNSIRLRVKKRRFFCKPCKKPFTEPVQGIGKGHRTTQRYRRAVLWACENFSDFIKRSMNKLSSNSKANSTIPGHPRSESMSTFSLEGEDALSS
jgi:transposase